MNEMLELINDYQETVRFGVEEMQKQFNTRQLLKDWRSGIISKSGMLVSGTEYDFHGVGCFLTINNITVNFDFGPDDRYDGFDLWRLGCFVDEKPEIYKSYFENKASLETDFQMLIEKHIIVEPKWFPGSSLYYFSDAIK
jgi:hypothetical protein